MDMRVRAARRTSQLELLVAQLLVVVLQHFILLADLRRERLLLLRRRPSLLRRGLVGLCGRRRRCRLVLRLQLRKL